MRNRNHRKSLLYANDYVLLQVVNTTENVVMHISIIIMETLFFLVMSPANVRSHGNAASKWRLSCYDCEVIQLRHQQCTAILTRHLSLVFILLLARKGLEIDSDHERNPS